MADKKFEALIEAARTIRGQAYAPYSGFPVGAAILVPDGTIFAGCNVENGSFGLTVCAERNAVAAMIAGGRRRISALAVALDGGGSPCGACRQVLAEFGRGFPILILDTCAADRILKVNMDDLLPLAFQFDARPRQA